MNDGVPVLECRGLAKTYRSGPLDVPVLLGVDLSVCASVSASRSSARPVRARARCCICSGGLDAPSAGEVRIQGAPMASLSEAERGAVRNRALGFIYQFHHLLPEFTALENVAMPLYIRRESRDVGARTGAGAARSRRPRGACLAPARRVVGRRAPARRAGARTGDRAGVCACRRADREPRSAHGRPGVRSDAGAQSQRRYQPRHRDA